MSFEQTRLKCRCLSITHSNTFGANQAYQNKHLRPTPKHGGGGVMGWVCFATTEPGLHAVIELTTNPSVYKSIRDSNVRIPAWELKLGPNWVTQ